MIKLAIPLLHVSNSSTARDFYCNQLGFKFEFAHCAGQDQSDPCYIGVSRDSAWLHISSFSGDGVADGVAIFFVDNVDDFHEEFVSRGVKIDLEPTNQTWGTREMYVKDADGNCLRFIAT